MTRLVWGAPGERFYETGVDRGVLYPAVGHGVPWNGLISVRERPVGGGATPYYIDGFKYVNVASSEEFEATLEAFSSPREFDECAGTRSISNGLFVTQQPRLPFGLTYRTKVGNDLNGLDHGYKLHLVYNALAEPSGRDNDTVSNDPDPAKLSWDITTRPPRFPGFRPTSHFIVDSRTTAPGLMLDLEDLIYGSDLSMPSLPSPSDLLDIFTTGE